MASLLSWASGSALVVTVDGAACLHRKGRERTVETGDGGPLQAHGASAGRRSPNRSRSSRDALDDLHSAFVADVVQVRISAKATLEQPVVVVHLVTPGPEHRAGSLPRASPICMSISEHRPRRASSRWSRACPLRSGISGLVMPLTELEVGDDARLSFASLQVLPQGWEQLGVQSARVGRDAFSSHFLREPRRLGRSGALGRRARRPGWRGGAGRRVPRHRRPAARPSHDPGPRRASHQKPAALQGCRHRLAQSAYVGLTRVRNGAHGADAFQTNRNLVLSDGAHADSVPTLDIQENDVRCSHASTVGPIDEDQRYYLESRGIDRHLWPSA